MDIESEKKGEIHTDRRALPVIPQESSQQMRIENTYDEFLDRIFR